MSHPLPLNSAPKQAGCELFWVRDCVFTLCSPTAQHSWVSVMVKALWPTSNTNRTWRGSLHVRRGNKIMGQGLKVNKKILFSYTCGTFLTQKTYSTCKRKTVQKIAHKGNSDGCVTTVVSPGRSHWKHRLFCQHQTTWWGECEGHWTLLEFPLPPETPGLNNSASERKTIIHEPLFLGAICDDLKADESTVNSPVPQGQGMGRAGRKKGERSCCIHGLATFLF